MQTLVLHDNEGVVFHTITGSFKTPIGIPFLVVEVPEGKRVESVDVSGENPLVILEDLPVPTMNQILERLAQQEELTEEALAALIELSEKIAFGGGI